MCSLKASPHVSKFKYAMIYKSLYNLNVLQCHLTPSVRHMFTEFLVSVRRIPLESIPEDETECAAWLHKLYQEKVSAVFALREDVNTSQFTD